MADNGTMRIAAVADIHYSKKPDHHLKELFGRVNEAADVLLLCGDLTDHGLPDEAHRLAEDLNKCVHVPILGVLGNHDFGADKPDELRQILQQQAGVSILDGDAVVIDGIGFAGAPGFAGGFDRWALHAWGETAIKDFVQAALEESLKLESALTQLDVTHKVVLLHYAPIRQTVEGEPLEIFPFLGSSRLEPPLDHFDVTVAFHGHAHKGTHAGRTAGGVDVFNVSIPVLKATFPDQPAFMLYEINRGEDERSSSETSMR